MSAKKSESKVSENTAAEETVHIVRKLTVKAVLGGKVEKPSKATRLMTVVGKVKSFEPKQTDIGISHRFRGDFCGIRTSDGHEFYAGQAFFPGIMEDLIVNNFPVDDDGKLVGELDIAFHIGVKPNDTPVGYEYTIDPVIKPKVSDALAHLKQLALEKK